MTVPGVTRSVTQPLLCDGFKHGVEGWPTSLNGLEFERADGVWLSHHHNASSPNHHGSGAPLTADFGLVEPAGIEPATSRLQSGSQPSSAQFRERTCIQNGSSTI